MPAALADTLESVELADGVQIHLRVAGPAVRSVAWLLDVLIFGAMMLMSKIFHLSKLGINSANKKP
jgi:hypothetical protein